MPLRKFLSNRTAKRKCRLNGIVPAKRLPHKANLQKKFSDYRIFNGSQLPQKVDLRFEMTPIEDQASIGSW
jgi:hypothetical protein